MNQPAAPLPPDRGHIPTERRNARSARLHTLSVAECVALIQEEDRSVLDAVARARDAIGAFVAAAELRFKQGGRLVYLGAGTSGRLGVLDASEAPPTFQVEPGRVVGLIAGGDAALRSSSEAREDDPRGAWQDLDRLALHVHDTVLGITAGGTTPYVLGALAHVKEATSSAPLTGLLVCAPIAKPAFADHVIVLETGPEVLTGSTRMKAGTATKMVLNAISTTLMIRSGRVYENLMVDMRATNAKLTDRALRIVSALSSLSRSEALALLERAGGVVKTALVMQRLDVPRAEAERLLTDCGGELARVLDDRNDGSGPPGAR